MDRSRGRRVLVTGAQGFTGRYMVAELVARGHEVIGLGSQPGLPGTDRGTADSGAVRYMQADLRDAEALAALIAELRPQVVIHLAALAFVGHGCVNDFYRVNLIGTRNLLSALASSGAGAECVLLASSANVYGNASAGVLVESTPPRPENDYAVSKLAMENMAALWRERLPIVITRPFNYTGVGQAEQFLVPKIVAHFRRRAADIELGNLDVERDFSDVRAVVAAYAELIASPQAIGRTINVCSGTAYALHDLVRICEACSGHVMEVRVNPAFVRANEVRVLRGDDALLRSLVPVGGRPGMAETLRWMLDQDEA